MARILIVKFGAIGDVIMAIPGAHALHEQGHEIDWVCGAGVLPVLQLYPWINPIVADDRALLTGGFASKMRALAGMWAALAGRHYELAATLYYDPRYKLMTLPVRAKRKLQLSRIDRALRLLPGRHHTDEYARILLERADSLAPTQLAPVQVDVERLPAVPLAAASGVRVVLAPAGAKNMMNDDALRRWPAENYVELTELLIAQGVQVVLCGGPHDAWVQPMFAGLAAEDLIGKLSLTETLALMQSANVTVTHDTGPLHMAGITASSVVGIFGPTDPRGRLPQRAGCVALWGGEGFACRPCYDGHSFAACPQNDCIREVSPADVFAVVKRLIAQRAAGEMPAPCVISERRAEQEKGQA